MYTPNKNALNLNGLGTGSASTGKGLGPLSGPSLTACKGR